MSAAAFAPPADALAGDHTVAGSAHVVVVGLGVAAGGLLTYQTSMALAGPLGTAPVESPVDHGGFPGRAGEAAEAPRKALMDG
ncbi:hypothetical protein [Nonomuraea sp. NPDC048916]|uniref:hypothetical protein n=1 Tax=Nonomuraea sp. NPDC048916 TaxID=3154232 RepID=UPI0033FD7756